MRIGIVGGGAWGTALAQVAARGDRRVTLWAREVEVVDSINETHENRLFLRGVPLSKSITATGDLGALADCDALLVVAPAQHVRTVLTQMNIGATPLVLCAKGIEAGTRLLVGEVARAVNQSYGPKSVKDDETQAELAGDLGDALFVLLCLANSTGVDLDAAFEATLEKYRVRDEDVG